MTLPQAHGSFSVALVVSLLSWLPFCSFAMSPGLQAGTVAGMSSVLLTMLGAQLISKMCVGGKMLQKPVWKSRHVCAGVSQTASQLHAKGMSLAYKKQVRGQRCTWQSHVVSLLLLTLLPLLSFQPHRRRLRKANYAKSLSARTCQKKSRSGCLVEMCL